MTAKFMCLGFLMAILILMPKSVLLAQSSNVDVMVKANQLYENGKYIEATNLYLHLVDQGIQNSNLHYNLGNAYFKLDQLGLAILNYKRASLIDPRDSDIRTNLDIARAQTIDQIVSNKKNLLLRIARFSKYWFHTDEIAIATLSFWITLVILLMALMHYSVSKVYKLIRYASIFVSVLIILGMISLGSHWYSDNIPQEAVVIADEVNVLSGPSPQYVTEFTLHNGTELNILETRRGWVRATLPGNELQGWMLEQAIQRIIPE